MPYQVIANNRLLEFLQEGNRLCQPRSCPNEMSVYLKTFMPFYNRYRYEVMKRCWCLNPDNRPSFDEVLKNAINQI